MKPCGHLMTIRNVVPRTLGCEECLESDQGWVHLRLCRECGHVGCCDNSIGRHATAHFQETGHPIIEELRPARGLGVVLYRRDDGGPAEPDATERSDPAIYLETDYDYRRARHVDFWQPH